MNGPFEFIRNKWEKTPLQRISQSISEVYDEIRIEYENLKYINEQGEREKIRYKISDYKKTIAVLKEEERLRKNKERKLKIKRDELMKKLIDVRNEENKKPNEKKLRVKRNMIINTISKIDEDLGPYRRSEQFYLD